MSDNKRVPTWKKLVDALEEASAPQWIIKNAREFLYDDYKSSESNNISLLIDHLRRERLYDLAQRAINGEFDGQEWEAHEWARSLEGQEVFREFGL